MIPQRLQQVREEIGSLAQQAGRRADEIRLIAVSKTRDLADVEAAIAAGQIDFGENTVQDALSKIPHVSQSDTQWHFIGHLQSKKCNLIPGNFHWIHSVDSDRLANKLCAALQQDDHGQVLNCLLQVNVSKEASKSGLSAEEIKPFMEQMLTAGYPALSWRGLMTMGVRDDTAATQRVFAQLRELLYSLQREFAIETFDQLSMGMSGDYAAAIKEGATMIRIGTAIFGERSASG